MSDDADSYAQHPRSSIKRHPERGGYDYAFVHSIIDACPVLHVSFVPSETDPFPTILPMIGALGSFASPTSPPTSGPMDLYLHASTAARFIRLSRQESDPDEGLPVCVAGTQIDGYILALSPFHHSMNYRSAVLHGYATLVTDPKEVIYAMTIITDHIVPDRWDRTRNPPFPSELTSTGVIKVRIENGSAKVRTGIPVEDRKDEQNEEVRGKIWTGVVPTWSFIGEPIPVKENRVEFSDYLKEWVKKNNLDGEANAVARASPTFKEDLVNTSVNTRTRTSTVPNY